MSVSETQESPGIYFRYLELAPAFLLCFGVELFGCGIIHRPGQEQKNMNNEEKEQERK